MAIADSTNLLRRIADDSSPALVGVSDFEVGETIEDFTPYPHHLEWRLSEIYWKERGVLGFSSGDVPFLSNCSGPASTTAAATLLANCIEAPPEQGPIHILELGAGTGLFARFLLDAFRDLCREQGHDFYDRLAFHVTDGSPSTVAHWRTIGIFEPHAEHVHCSVCDARTPADATDAPLRAVFTNYLLDSLPAHFLRCGPEGWEQVFARAWLHPSVNLVAYTGLTVAQMREAAATDPAQLLPLMPVLETELQFRPLPPGQTLSRVSLLEQVASALDGKSFCNCYEALDALEALVACLHPAGFVSIRDYGSASADSHPGTAGGNRFGNTLANGLFFPLIEAWASASGILVVESGDPDLSMHRCLLTSRSLPGTAEVFHAKSLGEQRIYRSDLERAREEAASGSVTRAMARIKDALAASPDNWHLLGEAAALIHSEIRNHSAALHLACAALHRNPWYSPEVWNTAGDCLAAMGRLPEARDCYLQSAAIAPTVAATYEKLAECYLRLKFPELCIEAVSRGLAADSASMLRQPLLETQTAAIAMMAARSTLERDTVFRRRQQNVPETFSR